MNGLRDALLLYAVTDRAWLSSSPAGCGTLERQVEEAVLGGATMVQLREKELDEEGFAGLARRVKRVTDARGVPLIINDSLEVALASGADGLHIGQDDGDVRKVRGRLGTGKILGVSAQTVAQAVAAEASGADYLGVGSIFPTSTKRDAADVSLKTLSEICAAVRIPVVAIGGIHGGNARLLAGTGIAGIAVVSALFARPGRVREAAQELKALASEICAPRGCAANERGG